MQVLDVGLAHLPPRRHRLVHRRHVGLAHLPPIQPPSGGGGWRRAAVLPSLVAPLFRCAWWVVGVWVHGCVQVLRCGIVSPADCKWVCSVRCSFFLMVMRSISRALLLLPVAACTVEWRRSVHGCLNTPHCRLQNWAVCGTRFAELHS